MAERTKQRKKEQAAERKEGNSEKEIKIECKRNKNNK